MGRRKLRRGCTALISARIDGDGKGTHLALQHAQAALKDVHDGVVDAFPVVYDLVVVDAGDQENGPVV